VAAEVVLRGEPMDVALPVLPALHHDSGSRAPKDVVVPDPDPVPTGVAGKVAEAGREA